MARLNAPAVAPESIESLKRRFIRQNRDIARVNTTQSLRIRELENEMSKLLSENLSLREQIIRLQYDQEARFMQKIGKQTSRLKEQLELKLLEISGIIADFGQESIEKDVLRIDEETSMEILKTPREKCRDTYETPQDIANSKERLSPILENGVPQLHTSENNDAFNFMNTTDLFATESPDIGSPPTSQFVDADPVKIDFPLRDEEICIEESQSIDPMLSTTVEQRKKRKESLGPLDTRQSHSSEPKSQWQENSLGIFKNGAKRKLCAREEAEKQEKMVVAAPNDGNEKSENDFKFSQIIDEETSNIKTARDIAIRNNNDSFVSQGSQDMNNSHERKVLAPKSVNMSPRKRSSSKLIEEIKSSVHDPTQKTIIVKEQGPKNPATTVINTRSSKRSSDKSSGLTVESESHLRPKTPASSDKIQITSLQSSNTRAKSEETTPSDLAPQADGNRPSRRVRKNVNYAEPNLHAKLRRPTQELADAVARDMSNQSSLNLKSGEVVDKNLEFDKDLKITTELEENVNKGSITVAHNLSNSLTTNLKRHENLIGMNNDGGEETGTITKGHTSPLKTKRAEKSRSLPCNFVDSDSNENQIWEGLSRRRRRSALAIRAGASLSKDMQSLKSVDVPETRIRISS